MLRHTTVNLVANLCYERGGESAIALKDESVSIHVTGSV